VSQMNNIVEKVIEMTLDGRLTLVWITIIGMAIVPVLDKWGK